MIRDFMVWLSESLFYIMNGVPIADSAWVFVWVVFWSLVLTFPMWFLINVKITKWMPLASMIGFFPILMICIGPPIVQMQMLRECETVELLVDTDRVTNYTITETQCRYKDNYYGDFGEWTLGGRYK